MIEINETTGVILVLITVLVCFTIIVAIYRLTAYYENIEYMKLRYLEEKNNIKEASK